MLTRSSASTVKHQPDSVSNDEDWRERAACRDYKFTKDESGEVFNPWFPKSGKPDAVTDEGLRYCRSCPVQETCLSWALANGEFKDGIFGATTPSQRRSIAGKHAKQRAA